MTEVVLMKILWHNALFFRFCCEHFCTFHILFCLFSIHFFFLIFLFTHFAAAQSIRVCVGVRDTMVEKGVWRYSDCVKIAGAKHTLKFPFKEKLT